MANQLGGSRPGRSGGNPGGSGATVPLPGAAGRPGRRSAEIDLSEARKAFFLMVGFIGLIWAIQIANWADRYGFDVHYGILPRDVLRLPDIFIAPFLHASWNHIEANSGPLFVFGFLAAYRGVLRFLGVTVVVAITSGIAVWFFQGSGSLTVGASGLIFGYFGYVLARGLIERNLIDVLISVVMGLSYYYLVTSAVPGTAQGVSWLAHLGGLVGGVACGWVFRTRRGHVSGPAAQPAARPAAGAAAPGAPGPGPAGPGPAGPATAPAPAAGAPGTAAGASGPATRPATGQFQPEAGNPRADLYEELRKLGY
jgi:membrane associated rhomboid family serine protease